MKKSAELRIPHASKAVCLLPSAQENERHRLIWEGCGHESLGLFLRFTRKRTSALDPGSPVPRFTRNMSAPFESLTQAKQFACSPPQHSLRSLLRRGRDSNPRGGFPPTRFRVERLRPLSHPSRILRQCSAFTRPGQCKTPPHVKH